MKEFRDQGTKIQKMGIIERIEVLMFLFPYYHTTHHTTQTLTYTLTLVIILYYMSNIT